MIEESEVQEQEIRSEPTSDPLLGSKPREILVIAGGGGLALAGSAMERLIGYIYSAALIWGLGAESFGLFTLALAISTFVGMMANLGLVQGVVRYGVIQAHARGKTAIHQVTLAALQVSLPASVLIMIVLIWGGNLLAALFHKPEMAILIKAMGISIPFMTIQSVLLASSRALKVMKYSVIVWVVQPLAALLLAIPLLIWKADILLISLAYSLSYILGACLATFYYFRLQIHHALPGGKFSPSEMVRFSLPLSFVQWISYANQRTETFFLGFLPSAVDVGVYNIALRLAGLETVLIDSLNKIFGPVTSELSHQREVEKLGNLYKTMAKWAFTGALILFLIYVLFSKRIMSTFDVTYVRGTTALVALGIAQLINALTGPCGTVLLMSGRSGLSLVNTLVLFGTSILLDWLLIPTYGLAGATIAGLATIVFVNVLRVVEVWITLKIHPFRRDLAKPLIAGLASLCMVYLLRRAVPVDSLFADLVWMAILAATYVLIIILLRLDEDDRLVLQTVQQRFVAPLKKSVRSQSGDTPAAYH